MKHNVAGPIAGLTSAADDLLLPPRASRALFWRPRLLQPSPWTAHIPFAFWLVESSRPRRVVELGLGTGVSYFAFAQAVDKLGLEARCVGVDHWRGDRFGAAGPEAEAAALRHNEQLYHDFSEILAADLTEAAARFPDASIDLLHVDVEPTPAVIASLLRDWSGKLSRRAVVLLHGVRSRFAAPEAAAFLARVRARHRTFELDAGEGLMLALIGAEQPERLARLGALEPGSAEQGAARLVFQQLGRGHQFEALHRRDAAASRALGAERDRLAAAGRARAAGYTVEANAAAFTALYRAALSA